MQTITSTNQLQEWVATHANSLTIVIFTSETCLPCHLLSKRLFELQRTYSGHAIHFLSVDIEQLQELSKEAGIVTVPTFHMIHQKKMYAEVIGDVDKLQNQMDQWLQQQKPRNESQITVKWRQPPITGNAPKFPSNSTFLITHNGRQKLLVLPRHSPDDDNDDGGVNNQQTSNDISSNINNNNSESARSFQEHYFLFVLDVETWCWEQLQSSGCWPSTSCVDCDRIGNRIFYFCHSNFSSFDLFILHLDTLSWDHVTTIQEEAPQTCDDGRFGYSVTAVRDEIVIFGGGCRERDHRWNELMVLETTNESFKWRKPEIASTFLPIPRQHHTLIAVPSVTQPGELSPSLVFLFGGEASGQDNFLEFNQLINLTIESNDSCEWREVQTPGVHPCPRTKHASCYHVAGQKMIFCGGEHDFELIDPLDVCVLDVGLTNNPQHIPSMNWLPVVEQADGQKVRGSRGHSIVYCPTTEEVIVVSGGDDDDGNGDGLCKVACLTLQ